MNLGKTGQNEKQAEATQVTLARRNGSVVLKVLDNFRAQLCSSRIEVLMFSFTLPATRILHVVINDVHVALACSQCLKGLRRAIKTVDTHQGRRMMHGNKRCCSYFLILGLLETLESEQGHNLLASFRRQTCNRLTDLHRWV